MPSVLLLKLLLTPLLIAGASLAARRWGPAVGGWLVGFPLTSGPVALFLALEQGLAFGALAAKGILVGLVPLAAFCLAYARAAQHAGWPSSAGAGTLAYLLLTVLFRALPLPLLPATAVVVACVSAAYALLPKRATVVHTAAGGAWDLVWRMVAATAVVLVITASADRLGPQLSGLITPFPVFAGVLAVFTHRTQGGPAAAALLRGVVLGCYTFAAFFVTLAAILERVGLVAFVPAVGASLVAHLWVFAWIRGPKGRPETKRQGQ